MPTSEAGTSTNNPPVRGAAILGRGFTLIEILVVVFIIGVIAGFAVLAVDTRTGGDRLQLEARRLHALMEIAGEDAVLFGAEIGLDLTDEGYRFLRLEDGGWVPVADPDSPLRPRALPEGIELRLLSAESELPAGELLSSAAAVGQPDADKEHTDARPEVLFLSSGTATPFQLELIARDIAPRFIYTNRDDGRPTMRREEPQGT